ncbi:MAG: FAD-dependent oxidoreductase [Chloroflexota bacterium]
MTGTASSRDTRSFDIDVVVAGAGGAGCAAALAAAQGGASVLVADARESFRRGCNTAMSTSMIPAGGSRWQMELGIDDSPYLFYADAMRKSHGGADPTITRTLVDVAPRLVEWLNDACAVPLQVPTDFLYPGHSRHRCHTVSDRAGATLHRYLLEAVGNHSDSITLAVPLRLRGVHLDPDGRVQNCTLERPDGTTEHVATPAVVLASGGFGANRPLVGCHLPEIAGALYFGSDGCVGDALTIADELDLDMGYLDAYQGHGSVATPQGILCTWIGITHGGFMLNAAGERFADESTGYSEFARHVVAQPGRVAWMVLDRRIDALLRPFADYQALLAENGVHWCGDALAVADRIGAPETTVKLTFDTVHDLAHGQASDAFGRGDWEAPLEPPYGIVKTEGALFHTQGGVLVDSHARVLKDGLPVNGLYAAGGAAAGMSGHGADGYLAGNGLLAALGLGYLAGRHVADLRSSRAPA